MLDKLIIGIIGIMIVQIKSITLTPSVYSVNPNYAKSDSSTYSFLFNAGSPFSADFDIYVYFPTNFAPSTVSNCKVSINSILLSTTVCNVSPSTNQIILTNLNITTLITNISIIFNTSTAMYTSSSTLIFYFYNTTTNTIIN
jgi:hypothetical protein